MPFVLSRDSEGHQAVFVTPILNIIEQRYVLMFIIETKCVFFGLGGSDGHQAVFVAPILNILEQRYVLMFIIETKCVFCGLGGRGSDGHQAVFVAPILNFIEQRYVLMFIMETKCVFCGLGAEFYTTYMKMVLSFFPSLFPSLTSLTSFFFYRCMVHFEFT